MIKETKDINKNSHHELFSHLKAHEYDLQQEEDEDERTSTSAGKEVAFTAAPESSPKEPVGENLSLKE